MQQWTTDWGGKKKKSKWSSRGFTICSAYDTLSLHLNEKRRGGNSFGKEQTQRDWFLKYVAVKFRMIFTQNIWFSNKAVNIFRCGSEVCMHLHAYIHILCCHAVGWMCKRHQVFVRGFSNSNDHQISNLKSELEEVCNWRNILFFESNPEMPPPKCKCDACQAANMCAVYRDGCN